MLLVFFFNFRIAILSSLILGLSTHCLGDFCVFTVSCLCKICPSGRCASTTSAILGSLVYFEIKVPQVIILYISLCTLLYRHYSVISGVIVLILTIIMWVVWPFLIFISVCLTSVRKYVSLFARSGFVVGHYIVHSGRQ